MEKETNRDLIFGVWMIGTASGGGQRFVDPSMF
jgi:hypothetical protein